MKQIAYSLTCLLLSSSTAIAQPCSLDHTFSGNGKTKFEYSFYP